LRPNLGSVCRVTLGADLWFLIDDTIESHMEKKPKWKSAWFQEPAKVAAAERVLRESRELLRDPNRVMRSLADGKAIRLPLRSDLGVISCLFDAIHRGDFNQSPLKPEIEVVRRILFFCRTETDLLTHQEAPRYGNALLAMAAHHRYWLRPLEHWRATSHNTSRQFRSLLRHLIDRYEVPAFLDAAWLEGLTAEGIKHQGWYKHIAQGKNIRTAEGLPFSLTRKQAHHFRQAPDDFDIPSAFQWAVIIGLGGDERLVRSILGTRIGSELAHDDFWKTVFRFFIAHPELARRHHGPIVDYLFNQKFGSSIPNPRADEPGQPPLMPPRPGLSMKGRTVESILRAVSSWHGSLVKSRQTVPASWAPSGFRPFVVEMATDDGGRRYEVVELLTAEELMEEGQAMRHCVSSYAGDCESGRTSIWSLRKRIESGRFVRLATVEVHNNQRFIVQVRGRLNKRPAREDLAILGRWQNDGGPRLSRWLTT
jgi:PcfJ-like protein